MSELRQFIQKSFDYELTQSQQESADKLHEFFSGTNNCFILKGYAGTGKTTLLFGINRYLSKHKRTVKLIAPTGRAAKVIADKTKSDAYTIHKSIYAMDDLKEYKLTNEDGSVTYKFYFDLQNNDDPTNTVYIIDGSHGNADIGEFSF